MTLPDIPRLYTALAEVLAVLVYAQAAPPRAAKPVTYAATAGWAAVLGVFLQLTGSVPLAWVRCSGQVLLPPGAYRC